MICLGNFYNCMADGTLRRAMIEYHQKQLLESAISFSQIRALGWITVGADHGQCKTVSRIYKGWTKSPQWMQVQWKYPSEPTLGWISQPNWFGTSGMRTE
jgi:hypothetical protein